MEDSQGSTNYKEHGKIHTMIYSRELRNVENFPHL